MSENPEGDKPEGDEKTVPMSVHLAERENRQNKSAQQDQTIQELQVQLAELKGQVQAKPEDKPLTRAQLSRAVEEGRISQDDADNLHDRQLQERITKTVTEKIGNDLTAVQRGTRVQGRIDEFTKKLPALMVEGTEERNRVYAEYQDLIADGAEPGNVTQLAALKAVYGSAQTIGGKDKLETHQETGGPGSPEQKSDLKLTPREKKFYEDGIENGRYKDWDEVKEVLSYR